MAKDKDIQITQPRTFTIVITDVPEGLPIGQVSIGASELVSADFDKDGTSYDAIRSETGKGRYTSNYLPIDGANKDAGAFGVMLRGPVTRSSNSKQPKAAKAVATSASTVCILVQGLPDADQVKILQKSTDPTIRALADIGYDSRMISIRNMLGNNGNNGSK